MPFLPIANKGKIDNLMYLDNINGKKNKDDSILNKLFKWY